jgi:hypothetical protein
MPLYRRFGGAGRFPAGRRIEDTPDRKAHSTVVQIRVDPRPAKFGPGYGLN